MRETCFHCGLPIPKQLKLLIHQHNEDHYACCVGCQVVAQTIIDAGLDYYYSKRTEDAIKAEIPSPEILAQIKLYDLEEIQENFVITKENDKREALLILEGITCAACIWLIEQRLLQLNGLISVEINYTTHRTRVLWDNSRLQLSQILEKIAQTGYTAYPYDASRYEEKTQKERKQALTKLWVAGLSMMQVMMYAIPIYLAPNGEIEDRFLWLLHWTSLILTLPVMLYCAIPFYQGTIRDIKNKRVGMDTPVAIAIIAAFFGSLYALLTHTKEGVFFDSISMFVFLLLGGRYLESLARRKAGDAIERLTKLVPAFCHKLSHYPEQQIEEAVVARIKQNDIVLIKAGEIICVDGIVLSGQSKVDEAMLTGESLPITKETSCQVTAGTLNIENTLIIQAQHVGPNTRLSSIVKLLDQALSQKPKLAKIADQFASWFVAMLLIISIATFIGWYLYVDSQRALWVTISLLVISCPCALSLATPTALAAATSNLARKGLLISKSHALETFDKISDVIFDKTGTLTEGKMKIDQMWFADKNKEAQNNILAITASLESQSNHPIASAFKEIPTNIQANEIKNIEGYGLSATIEGDKWYLGSYSFVKQLINNPSFELDHWSQNINLNTFGTTIFLGNSLGFQAAFFLTDSIKPQANECIAQLNKLGINTHLLSGDAEQIVTSTAQILDFKHYSYEATPESKLSYIEALQKKQKIVLMIGDGINDVPVLARADVSIAIGSGADIAKEGSDIILLNNDLNSIPEAWILARKTKKIIKENLIWASIYNIVAIPLAISGHVTPEIAALGMALSSILVTSNALRLLK